MDLGTPPCAFEDELPGRRPQPVSARAAERLALLTRAANPANPFDDELVLLALAEATRMTRAGEVRQILLLTGLVSSSPEDDGNKEGLARTFLLTCFPSKSRCITYMANNSKGEEWKEGVVWQSLRELLHYIH